MITLQPSGVPVPHAVAELLLDTLPEHICQAVMDAEDAKREVLRFRGPLCADDQADRELALGRMARANKVLAKHDPRLMVRAGGVR